METMSELRLLAADSRQALFDEIKADEGASNGTRFEIGRAVGLMGKLMDALPDAEGCHGLDTPSRVCFYEQDFYVLSNFSAFSIRSHLGQFATSEHAYHYHRFLLDDEEHEPVTALHQALAKTLADQVKRASSAHEAFKVAQEGKHYQRPDWDAIKVDRMRKILRLKAEQHEYVRRKLLATGDRELVENSWRDDFWGWGPNRDGQNMLGKLWMEVRAELRASLA